jgi:hypothetical protein
VTLSPSRAASVGAVVGLFALLACPHDPPILDDDPTPTTGADESTSTPPTTSGSTADGACEQPACVDGSAIPCDGGLPGAPVACPDLCVDGLGCVACEPGAVRCGADGLEDCDDHGAWIPGAACNAAQGFACDEGLLACVGPCDPEALEPGHLGCEFYAVPIATSIYLDEVFGVFVTNPGDEPATLTADRPLWTGSVTVVPPHTGVQVFLPWTQHLLTMLTASTIASGGAVRLQSDRPVAIVQHSPLIPNDTADASLLLPVTAWGSAYRVASAASRPAAQGGDPLPGVFAVVAARDGTTVELAPRPDLSVLPGDGVAADGSGSVVLDRGDILQVVADVGHDLTGSGVAADGPIAVIGGHRCTRLPGDTTYCDHLEEAMLPTAQLGRRHAVVPPVDHDSVAVRRPQVVRIIATEDLTDLSFDPPIDLPPLLVYAGDFVETSPISGAFVVESSRPVVVAQYMVGGGWDNSGGDPSLTLAAPVERFRTSHTVHASPYWTLTDVDVVAPHGAAVTVDGEPLTDWTPIGASDLAHAHIRLLPLGDAAHTIAADVPIGASVYAPGLGSDDVTVSYWHPAGYSFAAD